VEQTFIEILRRALDEELARDVSVHLLGEDVAAGGAFGVTKGLAQKHGEKRVRNTPISEAAITGLATGAALCGLRPVLEVMFIDFATLAGISPRTDGKIVIVTEQRFRATVRNN